MNDESKKKIESGLKKIQNNTVALMRLRRATFCAEQLKLLGDVRGNLLKTEMFLSLQDSLVVSYASCFASSGEGRATYTPSQVFKDKSDLLETHETIMEMRNNICAHNGNDPRLEDSIVKNEYPDKIEISFKVKLTLPSISDINNILKNIEIIYEYLHDSVKKTAEKLSKEIGKNVIISDAMGQVSKS